MLTIAGDKILCSGGDIYTANAGGRSRSAAASELAASQVSPLVQDMPT
jgi:hypothetical protein